MRALVGVLNLNLEQLSYTIDMLTGKFLCSTLVLFEDFKYAYQMQLHIIKKIYVVF